jgi:dTDP-4-dehydrorhamnose 3,5-epimerase-like enzyme
MRDAIKLLEIPIFSDVRGHVAAIDFHNLPFVPRRFFTTSASGPGVIRGQHGHFVCEQILFSLKGEISVFVRTSEISEIHQLKPNGQALYIPAGFWASQTFITGTEILGCIASHPYDPKDLF